MAPNCQTLPAGVDPSVPQFLDRARMLARAMSQYTPAEIADILKCSPAIAAEAWRSYRDFSLPDTAPQSDPETTLLAPAALRYTGTAFRHLSFSTLSPAEMLAANPRISICSFLYGLLRPLDLIRTYRMEGSVRLPLTSDKKVSAWWKAPLTEALIERVNVCGGTLLNLASNEMKDLFDWRRVNREIRVVTPRFLVVNTPGSPARQLTVYSKMCRGAMTRHVITSGISDIDSPEALASFDFMNFALTGPSLTEPTFTADLTSGSL